MRFHRVRRALTTVRGLPAGRGFRVAAGRAGASYFRFGISVERSCLLNTSTRSVTLHRSATASRTIVASVGVFTPRSRSLMYVYDMPAISASDRVVSPRLSPSSRNRSPNSARHAQRAPSSAARLLEIKTLLCYSSE